MVSSVESRTSLAPSMQQSPASDDKPAATTAGQRQTTAAQPSATVIISPEGAEAAQADASDNTTDAVSPVKSFAYGALGLERPDQTQDQRNAFYTAGKWLAAGITIGGLISLLA